MSDANGKGPRSPQEILTPEVLVRLGSEAVEVISEISRYYQFHLQRQVALAAKLEKRIEDLERRLNQNSGNSSKPPSTDQPGTRKSDSRPSGKNPGGQPGHKANFRAPIPQEQVDKLVTVKPKQCRHCQVALTGKDSNPKRRQTFEIPPMKPVVTEYQLHTLTCPDCGKDTSAQVPKEARGLLGPRAMALIATLTGSYHLSKRQIQGALKDLFGLSLSLGAICACEEAVSDALEKPVARAESYVQAQPSANADETGWKERRKLAWLWVLASPWVSVFKVQSRRNKDAMQSLLGNFTGVLTSDRWGSYNHFQGKRQICWAHLLRDFRGFREMRGRPGAVGRKLYSLGKKLFKLWFRVKAGTLTKRAFGRKADRLRKKLNKQLNRGLLYPATRRSCRWILKVEPHLWTFVHSKGVEPTNNAAERAIRPAVLWRKGSFGTHSANGSRFVERLMSVTMSLRQQKRNVLEFITAACQAHTHKRNFPSLLPGIRVHSR